MVTLPPDTAAPGRLLVQPTRVLTSIDAPSTTPVAISCVAPVGVAPDPVRGTVVSFGATVTADSPGIIVGVPMRPAPPKPNGEPPLPPPPFPEPGLSLTPAHPTAAKRIAAAKTRANRGDKLCID